MIFQGIDIIAGVLAGHTQAAKAAILDLCTITLPKVLTALTSRSDLTITGGELRGIRAIARSALELRPEMVETIRAALGQDPQIAAFIGDRDILDFIYSEDEPEPVVAAPAATEKGAPRRRRMRYRRPTVSATVSVYLEADTLGELAELVNTKYAAAKDDDVDPVGPVQFLNGKYMRELSVTTWHDDDDGE